jgi:hypothetical protein
LAPPEETTMSEREPEHGDEQGPLENDFQDSGLTDREELHASFEELEAPAPDTDPFAGKGGSGDEDGEGDGDGAPSAADAGDD